MEENKNLTAERSLEIITEQIEQSRRTVSQSTGQALYVSGLCTVAMSGVVAIVNYVSKTPLGHLLWLVLPVIIWIALRNIFQKRQHEPTTIVSSLVGKTWWTFAILTVVFFVLAILWTVIAGRLLSPQQMRFYSNVYSVTPTIMLLMGMAVTMTGHILRSRWLVVFGIVGGLMIFAWEGFGIGRAILVELTGKSYTELYEPSTTLTCLSVLLFAFVGLVIPGMMLKKQSL
ncbi:MAG: hypothetical protein II509_01820 [Prevotella sp.]|nr:hypothetical protein [Prevotella sp.]